MKIGVTPAAALRAELDLLAERVEAVDFRLPGVRWRVGETMRTDLAWTIREYLLPRLADLEAPILAVVIGSTGSGKSTLVNSLAEARISEPGAIRPTTRVPVVWTHEHNADRYRHDFLTGYVAGSAAGHGLQIVTSSDPLLRGVTVLDAPDFDSVVEEHREMVEELVAVADLTIFVTSAQRYADAVPWEFLERARRRRLPILFVLNRLPPEGGDEVVRDYTRQLQEGGILRQSEASSILRIAEQRIISAHGGLPSEVVAPLRAILEEMSDADRRRGVVVAATRGAIDDTVHRAFDFAAEVVAHQDRVEALRGAAIRAYESQRTEVDQSLRAGTLIRSEVLRRWQDFLGTGELLKVVAEGAGRLRRWAARVFGGSRKVEEINDEAGDEIVAAVIRRADLAAEDTASAWELDEAGRELLEVSGRSLWHHDAQTPERTRRAIEDWIGELAALIEQQGGGKRRWAQVASFGVNAIALVVLLAVFAQTGGITGAEVGVAAGAAAAQQKILEHVFGSAAARSLIEDARKRLLDALGVVLDEDRRRFLTLAEVRAMPEGTARRLREAATDVRASAGSFYGG